MSAPLEFSAEEVTRLRAYLTKGGFLWVDDFWGTEAWEQWSSEIGRVLPDTRLSTCRLTIRSSIASIR